MLDGGRYEAGKPSLYHQQKARRPTVGYEGGQLRNPGQGACSIYNYITPYPPHERSVSLTQPPLTTKLLRSTRKRVRLIEVKRRYVYEMSTSPVDPMSSAEASVCPYKPPCDFLGSDLGVNGIVGRETRQREVYHKLADQFEAWLRAHFILTATEGAIVSRGSRV